MFCKQKAVGPVVPTYWGSIQTIVHNNAYTVKRMWMKAGKQSSLEYHVQKRETYMVESGTVQVGLRTGRAENMIVELEPGDQFTIWPGQMHMRIAVTDAVILEVSTGEQPDDVYFVEDGKTYKHIVGKTCKCTTKGGKDKCNCS